jgi:hypothetical protein
MTAERKPDPVQDWRLGRKILDEEAERLVKMSDDEFDREMAKLPAPSRVPSVDELMARAKARAADKAKEAEVAPSASLVADGKGGAKANVLPFRAKRTNLVVWLAAAALGGLAIAMLLRRPDYNVATGYAPPEVRAAKMRDQGLAACERQEWSACEGTLDAAKRLDASGEKDPRVVAARAAIERAVRLDSGH